MNITPIIEAAAVLIAAIITAVIVPYIKSKTTSGQQQQINAWVKIAVVAAEQIYAGTSMGKEKNAYVRLFLAEHGIALDEEQINALIEAAVYQLKNGVIPTELRG
jgi:hypothetical protein